MASAENINKISGYADAITLIKDNYFKELTRANATMADQFSQTSNVDDTLIKTIYQPVTDLQDDLMREYANIADNLHQERTAKIILEYENVNTPASTIATATATASGKITESFAVVDTISPEIMNRDSVTLYNTQYLQIFCKVLGIVIIIAIFWNYFSSITGITSVSSAIPQSLPQPMPQTMPQPVAST